MSGIDANTSLRVLANYCAAAAESMGWTLMRTAYSTFVKETEDFSCQVMTPEGLTVASPTTLGATSYTGLDYGGVISEFDYKEGDICVVSDPYSGYVATHAPDLHMWKPVFRDGELMCFVGNHIHNTDVGGAVPASPGSGVSIMNVKTATRDGRPVMASIGPVGGGAGGGPKADGSEGCGANMSYLKNTPVEINEAEVPIHIRRYGLVADSGGAGRWRGGLGLEMEFQVFAPQTMVTARNRDRSVFSAWGLMGGKAGATSRFARNPGTEKCLELGSTDVVLCDPGDVILIQGPGAGGYGDPLERPLEDVLTDVRRGFVSAERARADYGVVIGKDFAIDHAATKAAQEELAGKRVMTEFGHGANRVAFEAIWTLPRYTALTEVLAQLPVSWRFFIKHRIFEIIGKRPPASASDASDIFAAYEELTRRFPDLPQDPLVLRKAG